MLKNIDAHEKFSEKTNLGMTIENSGTFATNFIDT